MKSQLSSREKTERALGKAAHPAAIERLYEIFPDAEVQVLHGALLPVKELLAGTDRYVTVPSRKGRFTTVTLSLPDGDVVANTQWTYPPTQWDRRRSLARAFHRLMKDISERTNEAERALTDA